MTKMAGTRLSRSERRKLKRNIKAKVALALALALLLLALGKAYWKEIGRLFSSAHDDSQDKYAFQALADSLIIQTVRDFQLSDHIYVDSLANQIGGPSYRCLRQPWPSRLPWEFYIRGLQQLCLQNELSCDCLEWAKQQKTTCVLSHGGLKGGQITLETNKSAKLKGRDVAFIIRNLGAWNNESILEIIDRRIRFGYIGTPDTYPTGKMKKTLEAAGIISILELPGRKSGLIDFKNKQGRLSGKKSGSDKELMAEIFERHPNLKIIYFDKTFGYELPFVRTGISQAGERKAAYLYNNSAPDQVDSLAYSGGLDIISAKKFADFDGEFEADSVASILSDLIMPDPPNRRILVIDAREYSPLMFIRLYDTFSGLGINIKNCIELTDTLGSLQGID